jgi:hypothetical protein
MKEEMKREWIFSVLADRLYEMGDDDLAGFFRSIEADPHGYAAQMLELLGRARRLTYQEGQSNWNRAAANLAVMELEHQNLEVEDLPRIAEAAIEANEDILQDDIVEIDRHPRVKLRAGRYPVGPAYLMVSGWFAVDIDGQGQVRPNPENEGFDEGVVGLAGLDSPPRWSELSHRQKMRLLQTITGFDEHSIRIENGEIWGRPMNNYAYTGMKLRWGLLGKALEQARQIGYIAEG